jgi:nitronate monooxygenase
MNSLKGNFEAGYAFAGSNAFRATSISSVKEVFQSLKKEYYDSRPGK